MGDSLFIWCILFFGWLPQGFCRRQGVPLSIHFRDIQGAKSRSHIQESGLYGARFFFGKMAPGERSTQVPARSAKTNRRIVVVMTWQGYYLTLGKKNAQKYGFLLLPAIFIQAQEPAIRAQFLLDAAETAPGHVCCMSGTSRSSSALGSSPQNAQNHGKIPGFMIASVAC